MNKNGFIMIKQQQAKNMMEEGQADVILDVRTYAEYKEGHIPNAVLLPLDEIELMAEDKLPNQEAKILVYCRSGVRSKMASRILSELGYCNIYEFGGITDWIYEIE